jgi:hypothetical protein
VRVYQDPIVDTLTQISLVVAWFMIAEAVLMSIFLIIQLWSK